MYVFIHRLVIERLLEYTVFGFCVVTHGPRDATVILEILKVI